MPSIESIEENQIDIIKVKNAIKTKTKPMEIKYSKQLMDNIDLKIDKGYKHIKEMMNEKYNNIILKDITI